MKFQWLRRFVRRHTNPIPEDRAGIWKQRLSIGYMLIAWNAFGIVLYNVMHGKADWATYHGLPAAPGTPAQEWSKTLGIKEATVYRVSGFKVDKYEVENEFDEGTKQTISSKLKRDGVEVEAKQVASQ